jgi:hypothetical protein
MSAAEVRFDLITPEGLRQLAGQGQKLALCIGRRPNQILPQEEGILWVTMDPGVQNIGVSDRQPSARRVHYQACFNAETARNLQGLFEKVVVDRSTYHHLDRKNAELIPALACILNPAGEGLLICDPRFEGDQTEDRYIREQRRELERLRMVGNKPFIISMNEVSPLDRKCAYHCFRNEELSWEMRAERGKIKEMIGRYFNHVEYKAETPFPYPSVYDEEQPYNFFVAKQRKV